VISSRKSIIQYHNSTAGLYKKDTVILFLKSCNRKKKKSVVVATLKRWESLESKQQWPKIKMQSSGIFSSGATYNLQCNRDGNAK
jgi:hypothetical protein